MYLKNSSGFVEINRVPISVPNKNAVTANIKQNRYFHLKSSFWSIKSFWFIESMYGHMFDRVDTAFSYGRALIVS